MACSVPLAEVLQQPGTSRQTLIDDGSACSDDEMLLVSSDSSDLEMLEELDEEPSMSEPHESKTANDTVILNVTELENAKNDSPAMEVLFKNHLMEPMSFVLLLHDFSLELKLTHLIRDCGGVVYSSVRDMDGYTVVLVKDESLHWAYLGPVFKVSYLQECVLAKRILNITKFFKNSCELKLTSDFNYMNVVYFKKYTWNTIPDRFISSKTASSTNEPVDSSSDDEVNITVGSAHQHDTSVKSDKVMGPPLRLPPRRVNKHTRLLYSRTEDENMIKYIIKKDSSHLIKGTSFWKAMENSDVCPRRTWQSMKEHFIKKLAYDLKSFKFLSEKQIRDLQCCVFK